MSPEAEEMNIPKPLLLDQANEILAEADQQLRSGKMSHEQHQEILKQLSELYRLQKLKLQLRENREREAAAMTSPPPPGGYHGNMEYESSGGGSCTQSPSRAAEEAVGGGPGSRRSPAHGDEPGHSPRQREPPSNGPGGDSPSHHVDPSGKLPLLPTPNIPPSPTANEILRPPQVEDDRGRRGPPLGGGSREGGGHGHGPPPRPGPPPRDGRPGPPPPHRGDDGDSRGPVGPSRRDPPQLRVPLPGIRIPKKQNSPALPPDPPKFVLPYNSEQFYVPLHDSRWYRPTRENKTFPSELIHEIYIDGIYYPVGLNQAPKRIQVDHGLSLSVNVDHDTKQVRVFLFFSPRRAYTSEYLNTRPWRVDFGFGQVDFWLTCLDGQVEILTEYSYLW